MIIGTGVDIVQIVRIEKLLSQHADYFFASIMTAGERSLAAAETAPAAFVAGRWAAKEAVAKALGVGFGKECGWQDVEVLNDQTGRPTIILHGTGKATADRLRMTRMVLSIAVTETHVTAVVVAEGHA